MICLQGDNFGLLAVPKQHASASGPSHLLFSARNALSPQYPQDLQLCLLSEVSPVSLPILFLQFIFFFITYYHLT